MGWQPMEQSWRISACKGYIFLLKAYQLLYLLNKDSSPASVT